MSSFGSMLQAAQAIAVNPADLHQWQGALNLYKRGFSFEDQQNMGVNTLNYQLGNTHLGQVRTVRKAFKEYSKEEFRKLGKDPMVKDILTGTVKLDKDQIIERIKEHVNSVK